jgi:predicted MFS family arabinose efflux permease
MNERPCGEVRQMMQTANPQAASESSAFYPGWGVAAAAFVGVMTSFAPIVPYTFSLFLNPLRASFGWQREAIGGAFGLAAITVALVSPGIGLLLDRFPPRRIILPCIVVFALALASLSRLGPHILRFYLTFFVLGLVANGTAQFAYTRTMLTWFRKHRGFALALILTGSGVGSILIPPATQWMIDHGGWRHAYIFLGVIAILGFPLTALLVRNRPASDSLPGSASITPSDSVSATAPIRASAPNSASASIQEQTPPSGVTVAAALRSSAFWILAAITILSAFSENGLVTNLAAILTEHGVTTQMAAFALSARGGAGIIARLCVGLLVDRLSPQRIQTVVLSLAALGTLVLAFAATPATALLGASLLGIGLGSEADVAPYLLARYFGRRHFSVLYGLTWTAYAIGGGTGPVIFGRLYDRAGSYQPRLIVGLAIIAFASAVVSLLLRSDRHHVVET